MKPNQQALLPARKEGSTSLLLDYQLELGCYSQKRIRDRAKLVPVFDFAAFRCSAVIDWIDLAVRFSVPTQARWVHEKIKAAIGLNCYVWPLPYDEKHHFVIRVQEPCISHLRTITRVVDEWRGLLSEPELNAVEISVDFYPTTYDRMQLAKLAGVLARHHLPSRDVELAANEGPRFAWQRRSRPDFVLPRDAKGRPLSAPYRAFDNASVRAPAYDGTFYTGRKNGPVMWRIMIKELDRQKPVAGTRRLLLEHEIRTRIEVTLNADELDGLGVRTLLDFQNLRFQRLQKRYFQFMLPTFASLQDPLHPIEHVSRKLEDIRLQRFLRAGVIGLREMDTARLEEQAHNRKRMHSVLNRPASPRSRAGTGRLQTMVSYETLTRKVADALGNLGRRINAAND